MVVFLTLMLLVYAYVALVLPPLNAPFLAVILIYFLWTYKFNREENEKETKRLKSDLESIQNELADIKKLLSPQRAADPDETKQENKSDENDTDIQ